MKISTSSSMDITIVELSKTIGYRISWDLTMIARLVKIGGILLPYLVFNMLSIHRVRDSQIE